MLFSLIFFFKSFFIVPPAYLQAKADTPYSEFLRTALSALRPADSIKPLPRLQSGSVAQSSSSQSAQALALRERYAKVQQQLDALRAVTSKLAEMFTYHSGAIKDLSKLGKERVWAVAPLLERLTLDARSLSMQSVQFQNACKGQVDLVAIATHSDDIQATGSSALFGFTCQDGVVIESTANANGAHVVTAPTDSATIELIDAIQSAAAQQCLKHEELQASASAARDQAGKIIDNSRTLLQTATEACSIELVQPLEQDTWRAINDLVSFALFAIMDVLVLIQSLEESP